ncbi:MAG: helix-turn-helix transcriptional regulator [Streptosporangiales bacterium]|nr:helix-turn-helix transcriptional regulator [Streptosporangiales bacterium]
MGCEWPLVGRAEELGFLHDALRPRDGPRGAVLAGAAGVGKTRLARETLASTGRRGDVTRWVAATLSARQVPMGAFGAWVGAAGGGPARALQAARDRLLAVPDTAGVVVGVDDAHLLDELSALLVHQLVVSRAAAVVVTVRTGGTSPDAVTALWKDGHLDRLELQPLSEDESTRLLEAVLGGPVESISAARMWALTQGNVLYLHQLVDGERAAGRLSSVHGVWRWTGKPAITPGLAELIEARMGALSEPVREAVDVLAVGEPLGVPLLLQLVDPAVVEAAEAAGVLTVERDGQRLRARLTHPLFGEVRRAAIGRLRARRLAGRIATAMATFADRRASDRLRRAVFALDSDLRPDPELLASAAQSAIRFVDLALAERLARAAIAAGGGFEPRLTLAYALTWLDRGAKVDSELAELGEVARTDVQRRQVAVVRSGNLFWTLRKPAEAVAVIDAADAAISDAAQRQALTAMRAAFHGFAGRPDEAVRCARAALAAADLPDEQVVLATWGLVLGLGLTGRCDEVEAAAARGYAAGTRPFDGAVLRFGLSDLHMIVLRLAGRLDELDRIAHDRRAESASVFGPLHLMGVTLLGHAALARGRLRTAVRWLREARAGLADADVPGWEFRCLLSLTEAFAMSGDRAAAEGTLAELQAGRHPAFGFLAPELSLAHAWVAAAGGAVTQAIELATTAAGEAARAGQLAHEVLALHTAVCFGDPTPAARLAELTRSVDGPRAQVAAAHAAALGADDGVALDEASVRWERMGDLVPAADAAAQAATGYGRRGAGAAAQSAAARAYRLAQSCEGARTPALVAVARPLPLTGREREIVTLAARGLTNKEIADRLVVSVRTVEGHLYRASAKLGVTRRADLAAMVLDC